MDPHGFLADIEGVPAHLRALAASLAHDPWRDVTPGNPTLIAGMGSSHFAGQTAAAWLRSRGKPAVAELASQDPSLAGGPGVSAVLVSASGTSAETLDRLARLAPGTSLAALTNDPESPLAQSCGTVVPMGAGIEVGGVACRTYRHTLALLMAWGYADTADACASAAEATERLLADRGWLDAIDERLGGGPGTFWIAPSGRIGSALQSALMMREGPRTLAVGCETGDWSHIDVYLTKTMDYRVVVFTGSAWDGPAADWLTQRASTVVSVGAQPLGVPGEYHLSLDLPPRAAMLAEPLVGELLAQRWWASQ